MTFEEFNALTPPEQYRQQQLLENRVVRLEKDTAYQEVCLNTLEARVDLLMRLADQVLPAGEQKILKKVGG
jgi:hypothetical protein